MSFQIIRFDDLKKSNVADENAEILMYPEFGTLENRNFIFRVSYDVINKNNDFDFHGFIRYISPFEDGEIAYEDGTSENLKGGDIYFFDGSKKITSDCEIRSLNLLLKKGVTGGLRSETVEDNAKFKISGGYNFIFATDESLKIEIDGNLDILNPGDALLSIEDEIILEIKNPEKSTQILIVEVEV